MVIKENKVKTLREYELLDNLKKLYSFLNKCKFKAGKCLMGTPECCFECGAKSGYLKYIIKEDAKNYLGFSKEDGFWDKDKGCLLLPKYRSVKCLFYLCDMARERIEKEKGIEYLEGIKALESIMSEMEDYIKNVRVN